VESDNTLSSHYADDQCIDDNWTQKPAASYIRWWFLTLYLYNIFLNTLILLHFHMIDITAVILNPRPHFMYQSAHAHLCLKVWIKRKKSCVQIWKFANYFVDVRCCKIDQQAVGKKSFWVFSTKRMSSICFLMYIMQRKLQVHTWFSYYVSKYSQNIWKLGTG
jgi:hypothetical protein